MTGTLLLLAAMRIATLDYSTDAGRTWSPDPPIFAAGEAPKFRIRMTYACRDDRPCRNGGHITKRLAAPFRWASSDGADKSGKVFTQQAEPIKGAPYGLWISQAPKPYCWDVDMTGLAPGDYRFRAEVEYWLNQPDPTNPNDDKCCMRDLRYVYVRLNGASDGKNR